MNGILLSQIPVNETYEEIPPKKKQKIILKVVNEQFYGVYCLVSQSPLKQYEGKCYIGYTVDPNRRIKQHNREIVGGAKKTKNGGPYEMVCIVEGFPNSLSALRFEWAWQNPDKSRRIKQLNLKKERHESHFNFKLRICCALLNVSPWKRLALSFRWLKPQYYIEFPEPQPPRHIQINNGVVVSNRIIVPQDHKCYMNIPNCYICNKKINAAESLARCISEFVECRAVYHKTCLATAILDEDDNNLVPLKGKCLICKSVFLWGNIIRDNQALVSMESQKPPMENGIDKIMIGNFERIV
uniref:Structure-specific endonuclease subunit SLX1 homolog n=1 Tax=Parastrongyloides trichosuri TaxID=131310 RepID=A0A0N5A4W2_PARTI